MLQEQFSHIVQLINAARSRAYQAVNTELIGLYWQIGEYLSKRIESEEWGSKVVEQLADYLKARHPDLKGFSRPNLFRMKQFYEAYRNHEIVSSLVRQISWTSNLTILSRAKTIEEKEFYVRLAVQERLSVRELERQINTLTFERVVVSKDQPPAIDVHEQAIMPFKDSYVFEFLDIPEKFSEGDLQKALLGNLKSFILELGKGFSFVGEQYRILVGNEDFYIDLLFFHRDLNCLVAVELKIGSFKPDHIGQLNFYLEALDRDVRKEHENPSIGILLCQGKNDQVVEYATSRSLSPTKVAEYTTMLPDKEMLQRKLEEFYERAKGSSE